MYRIDTQRHDVTVFLQRTDKELRESNLKHVNNMIHKTSSNVKKWSSWLYDNIFNHGLAYERPTTHGLVKCRL